MPIEDENSTRRGFKSYFQKLFRTWKTKTNFLKSLDLDWRSDWMLEVKVIVLTITLLDSEENKHTEFQRMNMKIVKER